MIKLGEYNKLTVIKEVDFGIYLDGAEEGEILMPAQYVPEGCKPGDEMEVFVYLDSEDRIIATTIRPYATVGQFAFLQVLHVDEVGAFLDWGLMKDLFVPFREQRLRMRVGDRHVVYVYLDKRTNRIAASAKVDKFIDTGEPDLTVGDEVDLLIYQRTDLGYKAIINHQYSGLLYENELAKPVRTGDRCVGFIKQIRPDDFKIDLTMHRPASADTIDDVGRDILTKLQAAGGTLPVGDKSPAEEVYDTFGVSKKVFKKALGDLYRRRLIVIEGNGIRIVDAD